MTGYTLPSLRSSCYQLLSSVFVVCYILMYTLISLDSFLLPHPFLRSLSSSFLFSSLHLLFTSPPFPLPLPLLFSFSPLLIFSSSSFFSLLPSSSLLLLCSTSFFLSLILSYSPLLILLFFFSSFFFFSSSSFSSSSSSSPFRLSQCVYHHDIAESENT